MPFDSPGDGDGGGFEIHFVTPHDIQEKQTVMAAFTGAGIIIVFTAIETMPAGTVCIAQLKAHTLAYVVNGVTKSLTMGVEEINGPTDHDV
jgi:hypothetical protein